jgi:hypothetical protein
MATKEPPSRRAAARGADRLRRPRRPRRLRRAVASLLAAALVGWSAGPALAEEAKAAPADPPQDEPEWEREAPTRRSGLVIGIQAGGGLGMASGYPLDLKKIGRAAYYTQTSVGLNGLAIGWIGYSLKDWLTFGVGAGLDGLLAGDTPGWGAVGVFRVEAFPLFPLGGAFREIGVTFDGGAALMEVSHVDDIEKNLIDAGVASYLGGGAFFEGIRFWRVSTGPGVYASYMWSDTVRHGIVTLDWRVTLYGGSASDVKSAETKKVVLR